MLFYYFRFTDKETWDQEMLLWVIDTHSHFVVTLVSQNFVFTPSLCQKGYNCLMY